MLEMDKQKYKLTLEDLKKHGRAQKWEHVKDKGTSLKGLLLAKLKEQNA